MRDYYEILDVNRSSSPKEIKESASYICKSKGGEGCVREFIEYIINSNL